MAFSLTHHKTRFAAFLRDEEASLTIEFCIWFPLFLLTFIYSVDMMVNLMRATIFDRALDVVVRQVRLGVGPGNYQQFKDAVCRNYNSDVPCNENLTLALLPMVQGGAIPGDKQCRNRASAIEPPIEYDEGAGNELMLVRACMYIDPLLTVVPFAVWGRNETTGYRFRAVSAFVNEPR